MEEMEEEERRREEGGVLVGEAILFCYASPAGHGLGDACLPPPGRRRRRDYL